MITTLRTLLFTLLDLARCRQLITQRARAETGLVGSSAQGPLPASISARCAATVYTTKKVRGPSLTLVVLLL